MVEIWDTFQDAEMGKGMGRGHRPPHPTTTSGSVVSSPSVVRGGAQAEDGFGAFWAQQNGVNAPLMGKNVKTINCNSGQFSVPNDLEFFSGQALKIRDCPQKFGTDGHLTCLTTKSVEALK